MLDDTEQPQGVKVSGQKASLVEHFSIEGLYGYRTVSLTSKYAATVLIAKNGSGKTTLLGALDAFLKGQFTRLSGLHFSLIRCRIHGVETPLVLTKADVASLMVVPDGSEILTSAKIYEVEPLALLEFVDGEYAALKSNYRDLYDSAVFQKIYAKSGYASNVARAILDKLEGSLVGRNGNVDDIRTILREKLRGIEVVYLPTYRRIELSLPSTDDPRTGRKRPSVQARLGLTRRGLYAGDIQFGLSDISERLATLNQDILVESNQGYREISANIINDLLSGAFEEPSLEERPAKDALGLFFSRIQDGRRMGSFSDVQIPDLDRIYSGANIPASSSKFLTYFLGKLNTVMQKTRDVEGVVEEFVNNCNRYLSAQDDSVEVPGSNKVSQSDDNKVLTLDRRNLKVSVSSLSARRKIPLDALSSGEKQMISLFARLYLYQGEKIVLIDEPELSLSIDWQRKILVDIVNAKSCMQVIAITHSPFVFDNELEPFATPLRLFVDATVPDLPTDEEEDAHD